MNIKFSAPGLTAAIAALLMVASLPTSAAVLNYQYEGDPFTNKRGRIVNPNNHLTAGFSFDDSLLDASGTGVVGWTDANWDPTAPVDRGPVVNVWAEDDVLSYDHGTVKLWVEAFDVVAWKFKLTDATTGRSASSIFKVAANGTERAIDRFTRLNKRGEYKGRTVRDAAGTWAMYRGPFGANETTVDEPHTLGLIFLGLGLIGATRLRASV